MGRGPPIRRPDPHRGGRSILQYVVRRLGLLVLILFGASLLVFFLAVAIPADPAREALGEYASNEEIELYRHERGLDLPITTQYFIYVQHLLRGDLGTSVMSGESVASELVRFLPATAELSIAALLIAVPVGLVLGVNSAVHQGSAADHLSRVGSLFGTSMPVFWLGLMLQLVFYRDLAVLPAGQRLDVQFSTPPLVTGFLTIDSLLAGNAHLFIDVVRHLVLPATVLAFGGVATIARITRSSFLEILRTEYIRTARSKGLLGWTVLSKHALPNALVPVVTVIGIHMGQLFSGAVLTETIFAWPGVGRWAVQAITRADVPVVMGVALFACAVYAVLNLVVDLSYLAIDPRVRTT